MTIFNKKHLLFFPLFLVLFEIATYLSTDAYLPALPSIMSDLNIHSSLAQLTLTSWFLGSASLQLILGPLSDYFGRRPLLLLGALAFVATCLICATTTHLTLFLTARFFQGATVCIVFVAGYAAIHELFEDRQAIITLAWMSSISVLAPAIGPLLGALLIQLLNWRWIFGLLALLGIATMAGLYFSMPESRTKSVGQRLQLGVIMKQYRHVIANPAFLKYTLMLCFLFSIMIMWITASPLLIISTHHYSVLWFGGFQLLVFGSFIMGNRSIKKIIDRYDTKILVKAALSIAIIASAAMVLSSFIWPTFLLLFIFEMMSLAFACGMSFPVLNRMAIASSDEPMGQRVAVFSSCFSFSGALGSALISKAYNNSLMSLSVIFVLFSCIAVCIGRCQLRTNLCNTNGALENKHE